MSESARPSGGAETEGPANTPLFVLPLHALGRGELAVAGGKGANLGELVRAGFPVPPGFVVTTAAYDHFVAENHLDTIISQALREQHGSGAAIRDAFERALIPPEVERACLSAYHQLGEGPVAVRSSATAEDLPGAAFAGQQDTFLNVLGASAVLDAVRRCFASLWTDRAIAYRARQGLDQRTVQLAVVVQRLVEAQVAGVMFTANPVTGARDEILIDASPGLGEAVVSGLVTPDHFVLRKRWRGWPIAERHPGRREVVVRPAAGGGTEQVSPDTADLSRSPLPDRAALHLARLGTAIQRHFGGPQDIEWAWAEGALFIVQARPMTALPEPAPHAGRLMRMVAPLLAEMLPMRPYPLDVTTWGPALLGAAFAVILQLVGVTAPSFDRLFIEEESVVVRFSGKLPVRPTPALLLTPFRLLSASRRSHPEHWQDDPDLVQAQARARALEERDLRALSWEELLATAHEALALPGPLAGEPRVRYFPRGLLALGCLGLLLALVRGGKHFGTLLSGVETKTSETNRALEALAAQIRSDPVLAETFSTHDAPDLWAALEQQSSGRAYLAEVRTFLDRYGHREAAALLVSLPTWKDAPETVLGILQGLAAAPPRSGDARPAWIVSRDELLAHPFLRLPPVHSTFLASLTQARRLIQIREDTHFYGTMPLPVLRRSLLECGRRLRDGGALDTPEDVFHLTLRELQEVSGRWPLAPRLTTDLRSLVHRRQERRTALEETPLIDPRLLKRSEPAGGARLSGTSGSPGVAEGPVRVIRDSAEFGKLHAGEVLVAPYTNPSWTPLFQRAIAVVVDSGAAGSHAAIVAREYGIPAVMGTVEGTRRFRDGERVRVDGTQGLVFKVGERSTGSDVKGQLS
jgi:phosphohistidine swiveling domain-containing protein